MQDSPIPIAMDGYTSNVPAFLTKLWTLVEDPETNHLICWSASGTSFHVFDQSRFAKEVLPKYFKHNNMASFVRQLNMYGFRKVVNIEQSGLVKPERDDTEFQHLYFLQGHEYLLEHIKRKVSVLKSEETKMRQEDLSRLLYEVQVLRNQQENMECQMQDMKHQNEVLWREVMSLRRNQMQQRKIVNKLIEFQFGKFHPNHSISGLKRKLPLMLDGGDSSPSESMCSCQISVDPIPESCFINSPSTEPISCLNMPNTEGPVISDITEMHQSTVMNMHSPAEHESGKCLRLVKEEPVSPRVEVRNRTVLPQPSCAAGTEPPVLSVSMVQSILEEKESCESSPAGSPQSQESSESSVRKAFNDR
ncbi:heat shock factor protein 4 [Protopterus annectens]|uniref:heat shock factor protein 4 n=1 Tax=Protopterus annectens TaxID=7888 RepID=UPI001CFB3797|nr:heat shock factor protein 4 [Protopterus annectens]